MGAFPACAAGVLKNYAAAEVHEGDAFITNHPYLGGSPHAPDMAVLTPIFYQREWVGFAANLAHKSDIGGPVPGSCWSQAREIYQEGLHLPPVKYVHAYQTSRDLEAVLSANSRTPELVVGDLRGQVGAARLGEKRFQEMMERYGKATILDSFEQLFALTEAKVRGEIASWPDGEGEGERFVDSDGIELDKPVRIHVRIEKHGNDLLFDLTGSADQTKGPANIRPTIVRAACCYLLTCLVDPALPINYGLARCIDIKVREGSVVNPRFPAPVNTYNPTVHALVEALLEASSQITPHKKVGDGCSSRSIIIGGRSNKTGKGYVQYEIFGGGSGGRSGKDGVSGTNVNQSNAKIAPIEIIEAEFATRVRRFELIPDSGGPGKFRGGLGFVREYEVLDNDARFSLRSTKHSVAPKGIDGGSDGKPGMCTLNPGTDNARVIPSRYSDHVMHPGEVFSLDTPGGGGLGSPLAREPQRVLNDVRNGYVTQQRAREAYGVAIDAADGDFILNDAQTRELRSNA
jgi:N-methylhydantoinase B